MEFKDEEAWNIGLELSLATDVYRYARIWAELMEGELRKGYSIAEMAKMTAFHADFFGITRSTLGAVVRILKKTWIHGKELQEWYKKEYTP